MTIRDWPDTERPREKLRHRGAGNLSDAELLAVFIGSGHRGASAVDVGRPARPRRRPEGTAAPQKDSGLGPVADAGPSINRPTDSELRIDRVDRSHSARYLKCLPPTTSLCHLFLDIAA
jgi:DNA repair protein RadC